MLEILLVIMTIGTLIVFFSHFKNTDFNPSIIAWFGIALTTILSLITFIADAHTQSGEDFHKFIIELHAGGLYFVNAIAAATVFSALLARLLFFHKGSFSMRTSDAFIIGAGMIILYFWITADTGHRQANLSLQGLMAISYILLVKNIYHEKKQIDSILFWIFATAMSIIAVPLALGGEDRLLAMINAWRSVASTSIVLIFLVYYRQINQRPKT